MGPLTSEKPRIESVWVSRTEGDYSSLPTQDQLPWAEDFLKVLSCLRTGGRRDHFDNPTYPTKPFPRPSSRYLLFFLSPIFWREEQNKKKQNGSPVGSHEKIRDS